MSQKTADRLAWWREARLGMFIHWGLYALPAGFWKGQRVPGLGEWIMHNGRIPLEEYAQLAKQFNPVKFNADEWVSLAARAGMKYIVITAKHHDGFAMFYSPSNPYNIVEATPYGRDIMKDLAEACARYGLRLCFYYSQDQDWAAEGASGHWEEVGDKGWWGHKPDPERFAAYLERKVKPQLRELLTQYGPIGLIWFDTPVAITEIQSQMLRDFVHSLQPDCLVNGRVGHNRGDYGSLGDNMIPLGPVEGDWETPATMNDTWGYRADDHNWKSLAELLYLLVDLASKGVNYLLNVGPTAEGEIPPPCVERLEGIGRWMQTNGEAIYGTERSPWPYEFRWGRITVKGQRLYLLCYQWPAQLLLPGLRNRVTRAFLLADGTPVTYQQTEDQLLLELPTQAPDPIVSVVALDFEGALEVEPSLVQQADGSVTLPGYLAHIVKEPESTIGLTRNKLIAGWKDTECTLNWRFRLLSPGRFVVRVILGSPSHGQPPAGGHLLRVSAGEAELVGRAQGLERVESPRARYFPEYAASLGEIDLNRPGWISLTLQAEEIAHEAGITLAALELHPA